MLWTILNSIKHLYKSFDMYFCFNIANLYNNIKMIRDFKGDTSFYSTCINHAIKRTSSSINISKILLSLHFIHLTKINIY